MVARLRRVWRAFHYAATSSPTILWKRVAVPTPTRGGGASLPEDGAAAEPRDPPGFLLYYLFIAGPEGIFLFYASGRDPVQLFCC